MATMPDSFFSWVVFLLNEYGATLLQGAGVTLLLALVGTFIGCVIGLAVGICQTIPEDPNGSSFKQALVKGLKAVLSSYVEIFRGTPMIVQAMVVYYGAMSLFDIDMSAMFAGFLVVADQFDLVVGFGVDFRFVGIARRQTGVADVKVQFRLLDVGDPKGPEVVPQNEHFSPC